MRELKKNGFKILAFFSSIIAVGLFLFSYTQVDLSLTLSQQTIFQTIQKSFQHIGFYERPLATFLYIFLLACLLCLYLAGIWLAKKKVIGTKQIWIVVAIFIVCLFFAYPAAFSYDIFNYIFTAKTVLLYGKNPYIVTPLQFNGIDPMLSFMRWTHLPSAYPPLWIVISLFPFLLSFNSLLLSFWTMKLPAILFYVISIWSIGKILKKISPDNTAVGMVAFALNPLVIIEVFISGHNDMIMMGLSLLAYQLWLEKKSFFSFFIFALSVATKFITIFLFPLYFLKWSPQKALLFLTGALIIVLFRREFLPWYLLWIIPFAVLLPKQTDILIAVSGLSVALLLRYAPVLYYGDYNPPVPLLENGVFVGAIIVTVACIVCFRLFYHSKR